MAIESFARPVVEEFFYDGKAPHREGWAQCASVAKRKLDMVHAAEALDDLKSPPGNRLEALQGDWAGYYSIRINDQWRVVFRWELGAWAVDIVDYH